MAKAKELLSRGAPINWQDAIGRTPLHKAVFGDTRRFLRLLIEHKANLNIADKCGWTPLILASRTNRMAIVHTLVEAGADTRVRGNNNKTAAEHAKQSNCHHIAEYLDDGASKIRFHSSTQSASGQLNRVKGRSLRAIERDLKESCIFDDHMLLRLRHFCTCEL